MVKAARDLDPKENVFEQHRKKQFQWVLSIPAAAGSNLEDQSLNTIPDDDAAHHILGVDERRYFGCNLLSWTKPAGREDQLPGDPEDKYLLLATPIDLKPDQSTTANIEFTSHQFRVLREGTEKFDMAAAQVMRAQSHVPGDGYRPSPLSATSGHWSTTADASDSDNTLTIEPRREMKQPLSTIENSFEELDQLEEEMEAIAAATARVVIAKRQDEGSHTRKERLSSSSNAPARTASPATPSARRTPSSSKRAEPTRRSSARDSSSMPEPDREAAAPATPTATLRKVARPSSLAPPRPIQKANKAPTIPVFELPGERVARELKEKKAARLSKQADPQKAAEVVSPPQRTRSVRSSKPPTVPNFELPGERFSRLKKERLEQKLREEEEEMRRRRQFKAKPSPSVAVPTVRSTFTSRQRQTTGGQSEQVSPFSPIAESSPRSGAAKRQAMTVTPSSLRTASITSASTTSTTARGRTSSVGSAQISTRTASSSVGSFETGGKRSSISNDEIQQQKVRGRQIYTRDNTVGQTKEQEKREREEAIKLARQKYAQMSRNLATQGRARTG